MAKNDVFAQIAAAGISGEGKGLIIPQPPVLEEKYLAADRVNESAVFEPLHKMSTREELYAEVERQKEYYRPFLADHAPALEKTRERKYLRDFQWRMGTDEDVQNFAGVLKGEGDWTVLQIPHYGEPRGVATTYYRTTFTLDSLDCGSLWLHFKGVDYKAHVFLNGRYLGSHEGFFAPFEFDVTACAHVGENTLVVMVENDYIHMGSATAENQTMYTGDKLYAATGLGYDDPQFGWHHCPPGMGIYQDVYLETRSRLFISDIFVRPCPKEEQAEVWLEVSSCDVGRKEITVDLSVYGQNFEQTVTGHLLYHPSTNLAVGMGDSLTEAECIADGSLGKGMPLFMERGINYLRIPVPMKGARIWDLDTPWLYQVQVRLLDGDGNCTDSRKRQFGIREFMQDENSDPKGKFYLNGREIRLRGANTMGFEQQDVYKKDFDQLLTDLLLAKICNMNFLRLTQRPVQDEIYELADRLGLMLQTDLPLFACLRRNQFAEGIRQTQEMVHLVRSHPSSVVLSYINEPAPNARNMPHRCLTRPELESFFTCADIAIRLLNPDQTIKHIDGDYDPPTEGYPDNHCYPCWYNGHGIDIGRLYKGYWMYVKDGWHYGCGEFGIEGLDNRSVMEKYYPRDWLPQDENEDWNPGKIIRAQTQDFHRFFYDSQHTVDSWIEASQTYQAQAVKLMTESYRRDRRMNSFALHLFIDAFPDGWIKTIMDVDRNPKKAFFAYRNALAPTMVNLRCDRHKVWEGERLPVELWLCNDTQNTYPGAKIQYQVKMNGELLAADSVPACISACDSVFQGFVDFHAPQVTERTVLQIQAALAAENGTLIDSCEFAVEVFPAREQGETSVCILGEENAEFENALNLRKTALEEAGAILVTDYDFYRADEARILRYVEAGAKLIFLELPAGTYEIAGGTVRVKNCSMLPLHFASRATGHPLVAENRPDDFKYWYDEAAGYITPLLYSTLEAEGYTPILFSGNQDRTGSWQQVSAAAERTFGKGTIRLCQLCLTGRLTGNPTAKLFAETLLK